LSGAVAAMYWSPISVWITETRYATSYIFQKRPRGNSPIPRFCSPQSSSGVNPVLIVSWEIMLLHYGTPRGADCCWHVIHWDRGLYIITMVVDFLLSRVCRRACMPCPRSHMHLMKSELPNSWHFFLTLALEAISKALNESI